MVAHLREVKIPDSRIQGGFDAGGHSISPSAREADRGRLGRAQCESWRTEPDDRQREVQGFFREADLEGSPRHPMRSPGGQAQDQGKEHQETEELVPPVRYCKNVFILKRTSWFKDGIFSARRRRLLTMSWKGCRKERILCLTISLSSGINEAIKSQ